jgi:hypothetical protein
MPKSTPTTAVNPVNPTIAKLSLVAGLLDGDNRPQRGDEQGPTADTASIPLVSAVASWTCCP